MTCINPVTYSRKRTISDYMNLKTERGTFVPVGSPLAGKKFEIVSEYNIAIDYFWKSGADIDPASQPCKPLPNIEFILGMHFQLSGKRKDLKSFCEEYNLP